MCENENSTYAVSRVWSWSRSSGARICAPPNRPPASGPVLSEPRGGSGERGRAMDDRRAPRDGIDRRSFLKYSAVAGAAVSAVPGLGIAGAPNAGAATTASDDSFRWNEATIAELQAAMNSGETTSLGLTRAYI